MKVTLREILIQDRKTIDPRSPEAGQRPYLGLEHIEAQSGKILVNGIEYGAGDSTTFAFDERHILYGKLRPYLNKVASPTFTGRCSTELIPFLPTEQVDKEYALWLLRSPPVVEHACQQNNGSRMPRVDLDHFLGLQVDLPDLPTQKRIAGELREKMETVAAARNAIESQLETVNALPAAYLREVFGKPGP